MTSAEPDTGRLVRAHLDAVGQLRTRVERFVDRAWGGLEAYREADIAAFVAAVVPVVTGAQRQVASLTDAYLARVAAAVLGEDAARPAGVDPDEVTGAAVRGIDPEQEYQRAGVAVWTALAEGKTLDAAAEAGRRRAVSLAATDLQLARTHASRAVLSRDERVAGYRRVLTGSENCALCTIASSQRYHRERLSPIHPGCDCGVAPIYGEHDPGQVLDADRLERAHQQVAELAGAEDRGGRAPDYRDILIRDHGEYGPTLTWRDQQFTSAADL